MALSDTVLPKGDEGLRCDLLQWAYTTHISRKNYFFLNF